MKYDLTPIWMAVIKKTKDSKCWQGYGEKETLVPCCWECKLVYALWKTILVSQKIKNRTDI